MLDVTIRNGMVVDGTGAPGFRADVAISEGSIVEIGRLQEAEAELEIDATGQVVAPGFIDMHSHTDFTLPINPTQDSLVHQGVTSAVIGQCGVSPAPLLEETRDQVIARSKSLPLPWEEWSTFGSYLDYLRKHGVSINVVPLVGHGTVRKSVMGPVADPPSGEQMDKMHAEVLMAMDEGAIGVSTGLIYPPGSYCSTLELMAFMRPVGERGGYYFSHIRGEGHTLVEAISEAIRIGRESGAAVQISHFKAAWSRNWEKAAQALELVERARAEGLDVAVDMYPYTAGATGLAAHLPPWVHDGGSEACLKRLADSHVRKQIVKEMKHGAATRVIEWDRVGVSNSPNNRTYEGHSVASLAREAGVSVYDWICDTLIETELDMGVVVFAMSEENVRAQMRHPLMMFGTDGMGLATEGPLSEGLPHPRSYGAYPRVLGHYVREQKLLSLEEAIYKMTGLPAQRLRWSDRGLLKQGYAADLVVLDPDRVADLATYEAPHRYPDGISHVFVNGEAVIRDGRHTGSLRGRVLGS